MSNASTPVYVHLWNGEGYRIPYSFWSQSPTSFESHQGEHFRLVRNSTGVYLFDKSGVAYSFDPSHMNRLSRIIDPTGNNTIQFGYYPATNQISNITDTVGRVFQFCYAGSFLISVNQTSGRCGSVVGNRRGIVFRYSGQNLGSVFDPAGRVTSYLYLAPTDPNVGPWFPFTVTYPTKWYTTYSYVPITLANGAVSYRVSRQLVNSTSGAPIRRLDYNYTQGYGDQVTNSAVTQYNGTLLVSYTSYAFGSALVTSTISHPGSYLDRSVWKYFGVHGEVPKEVTIVAGPQFTSYSYTNYYRYDLWGNLIYSRRVINPSANWYHESFNSYYNNGLSPGFYAFQETFSQRNFTLPDNQWSTYNGTWLVKNGVFDESTNGAVYSPLNQGMFAWTDIRRPDISINASVYVPNTIPPSSNANQDQRVGLLAHYPGSGLEKWALVLHLNNTGAWLSLLDDGVGYVAENPCGILTNEWYRFNFILKGNTAWGWAVAPGVSCTVSGNFSAASNVASATGFGLYAGDFNPTFDNVTVTTVSPLITGTGFSNSFIKRLGSFNVRSGLSNFRRVSTLSLIPGIFGLEPQKTL
jgi:hypothetical protein